MTEFLKAVEKRRSIYTISKETTISDEEIIRIIERLIVAVPSGYNSQSSRVVVLFGEHHTKLWSIVLETLRSRVAPEKFGSTKEKLNGFLAGYGTLLFYDDTSVTLGLEEQFPKYRGNFQPWADQSNGMLQFAIWTALEDAGLGVNIQHYNPVIDEEVAETFSLPKTWRLIAQMPFGKPYAYPEPVEKIPVTERMMILRGVHSSDMNEEAVMQKEEIQKNAAVRSAEEAMKRGEKK